MKVLIVNCVWKRGSTGKLVYDLYTGLQARGADPVVCYGRGEKASDAGVFRLCSEPEAKLNHLFASLTGLTYGGCLFSTGRLLRAIEREKPDAVHLHCINGYFVNIYRLIQWLKTHDIPTVLTLHAEFMHTANCSHALSCEKWKTGCGDCPHVRSATGSFLFDRTHASWKKMYRAFQGFSRLTVTSVSPWLRARAEASPILQGAHHVTVLNGVDTAIFRPREAEKLRKTHALEGKQVVLHVTAEFSDRPGHIKGGEYVLSLAQRMKGENVVFLVAAGHSDVKQPLPENVILLGNISDQTRLAEYYTLADVTLLTSQKETFSMPVAESLCCGTPVAGFQAGAPETIALPQASAFVPFGDLDGLETAVRSFMGRKPTGLAAEAARLYDKQRSCDAYFSLYK